MAVLACLFVAAQTAVGGPKIEIGEDGWIKLSLLGQPHYKFNDNLGDQDDFYLRRGRLIFQGQIADGISLFMETDNDKAGMNGAGSVSTDVQDAWVDFRLAGNDDFEAWVMGGLILLPFSFENRSSAASLLGIDYNAETIKFVNSFVWRDMGAEVHGRIGKLMDYRVGIFDGYETDTKNEDAELRFCGHVSVNALGEVADGGWFPSQNRLGKAGSYITLGFGMDSQKDASLGCAVSGDVTNTVVEDADAWVVDLQSSVDLGGTADLLVNAAYYDWDNAVSGGGGYKGNTAFVETGLVAGGFMPTFKVSMQEPDSGTDTTDYTVGLNYFIHGQNARAGMEYTWGDTDSTDGQVLAGLQFLL